MIWPKQVHLCLRAINGQGSALKLCPYCGENIKLLPKEIIAMEDYR